MADAPEDSPSKRLLIVRLSAMGDVIHTLPAAQALREAFPQAEIGWLIEERWAELLCAPGTPRRGPRSAERPLVDWVHTVKLKRWQRSLVSILTAQQIATLVNDVRSMHYDIAIDLQGAMRSAILARWSGARVVYGATEAREIPASLWYTRRCITQGEHVVEQGLSLVESIARKKAAGPRVRFPYHERSEKEVAGRLAQTRTGQFAILNPGAGWGAKRWPAKRYGEVAEQLREHGLHSIVNYGPGEEELAREVESASRGAAQAMKTSLSELIALTRRAQLFIGGDTGPMHLAAALSIPVVAIFGPTDPRRNGPFRTRSIVLRNPASQTSHARLAEADRRMLEITADSVVAAAQELLSQAPEMEQFHD